MCVCVVFFFKQKTAYEMRISDWSSDVCSSDLADSALSEKIRLKAFPDSTLKGPANLLITPNLDTGNITYNMLKMTGSHGVAMGPVLLGAARPVHVQIGRASCRERVCQYV